MKLGEGEGNTLKSKCLQTHIDMDLLPCFGMAELQKFVQEF
jgi:hypothetical protein